MTRERKLLLATLAALAVVTPTIVVTAPAAPPPPPARPRGQAPRPVPDLSAALTRPLFATSFPVEAAAPADAPALIGIVGRLNADAVALVRTADGSTRTLATGEGIDGWQLRALAIDAAFFTRGAQEVRVPLPTGNAEGAAQ